MNEAVLATNNTSRQASKMIDKYSFAIYEKHAIIFLKRVNRETMQNERAIVSRY